VPESLVVVGGGAVGCELSQLYTRLGAKVTLVQSGPRLLPQIDAEVTAILADRLREEGVDIRFDAKATGVEGGGEAPFRLELDGGGDAVEAERLLIATGRRPNVDGLGFEQLGIEIAGSGIAVGDDLRAAEDVWAIGDVNGIGLFTHVGKYQARIAAVNVAGGDARADYRAMPAVAFTDPQVASVGATGGDGVVTASWKVSATARASTYERPKRPGFVKLFADPERQVLVGAAAVGPEAGEWLGQLTVAIRGEVPIDVLRDTIQPYPTFSEAIHFALRDLPLEAAEHAELLATERAA
jgi:dihydrolipoamide dehydrogenase